MRLLNVDSLELEDFYSQPPKYATLSHTWGAQKDEVSVQTLQVVAPEVRKLFSTGLGSGPVNGISKIAGCCIQAKKVEPQLQYVWIDTCCIDKTSATEETESINSMFDWYAESEVCFVHLADVTATRRDNDVHGQIQRSRWFLRGWTLQELLAPRKLLFYNRDWSAIGDSRDLTQDIFAATKISSEHLDNFQAASVATKMSWASRRQTSRVEDRAYSLLGVFGVSMYIQYGERDRAFQRLQRVILENSADESVFAWTSEQLSSGLLAPNPDCFLNSADIISNSKRNKSRAAHRIVFNSVEFWIPANIIDQPLCLGMRSKLKKNMDVTLNCWRPIGGGMKAITIVFRKEDGHWRRVNCRRLDYRDSVPGKNYLLGTKEVPVNLDL